MSTVSFTPLSAFSHLSTLADQYIARDGQVELNSVATVASAFSARQGSLHHAIRGVFSSTPPITVVCDNPSEAIDVYPHDKNSNIQALRRLFQMALQWEESHSSEAEETQAAKFINFILREDTDETEAGSCPMLQKHALQRIQTTSLECLETVCSQASTVFAISMDVTHFLETKRPPVLLGQVCTTLNTLCACADHSKGVLVASILRKIFDIAFVAIVQQARTNSSLSEEERLNTLCGLWHDIYGFFNENLKLPVWASRVMDFQERSSLIKAGAALDVPELSEAMQKLFELTKSYEAPEEQTAIIAALKDIKLFLQNTATRTSSLESSLKLEALVEKTDAQIKGLRTGNLIPLAKEPRWKVAKKILFDQSSPLHAVLSRAFSGALTGAFVGLVSGTGLPGMIAGAIAGGATDATTSAVAESIDPVVNHLPLSKSRKRSIRQICRTYGLPLLGLFLSIVTARFLTQSLRSYFSGRRTARLAQPILTSAKNAPGTTLTENAPPPADEPPQAPLPPPDSNQIKQFTVQASGINDPAELILREIPQSHVTVNTSQMNSEKIITVELKTAEVPTLEQLQSKYHFTIIDQKNIQRFSSMFQFSPQAPSATTSDQLPQSPLAQLYK